MHLILAILCSNDAAPASYNSQEKNQDTEVQTKNCYINAVSQISFIST